MRLVGTAMSGLLAQQTAIDTIGNNLANANTQGYKASQMAFVEALSTEVRSGNTVTEQDGNVVDTFDVGAGVLYGSSSINLQQGNLSNTERVWDLGIEGSGFFQVQTSNGETSYTRVGAFQIDANRQLADMQGNVVQPAIMIPEGASDIVVAENGEITGVIDGEPMTFGQITLVGFQNPGGLQRAENNLFLATENSGQPLTGQPGSPLVGNQVLGVVRSHSLEQSNVDIAASMTDLIQAQRAYQANARLVQDGDKMWGIANSMRR
ncbi:flagellar basal body rod protein FlgG [Desulfosporosinus sp. HMP52]|uniref:flagellar hook-basal body protein n=1 Tax=Desulfosporosinus sp. HMP52 TaxID=1487923 RepID=UPI00051FD9B5|nr:flagellar hook-basal body complex protein [Desulfosporosinus sp. HMP52]KGK90378.1 flagellar basal body rod protein FlgG [Desulfosporosinus sp. HMP52]